MSTATVTATAALADRAAARSTPSSTTEPKAAACVSEILRGGVEAVEAIAPDWRAMCDANPAALPYWRPEWFAAYLRNHQPRAEVVLATVRRGNRLIAVLPLVRERGKLGGVPVTRLRVPGDDRSPYPVELAHAAGERQAAVAGVWAGLRGLSGWDVLELADVPEGAALGELQAMAAADGMAVAGRAARRSPYLRLPGPGATFEQAIAHTDGRFRGANRRHWRNLSQLGEVRFTKTTTADPRALDAFFALEASGWKGDAGTAIAADPNERGYFTDLARAAADGGYLTIYAIELDGVPISMQLGFTINGVYAFPKCAYDERYKEYAPGHLIVNEIVRDLVANGVTEFDFMGADTFWKLRWTKTVRPHQRLFVVRRGPAGRAAFAMRFRVLPFARVSVHRGKELSGRVRRKEVGGGAQ